MSNMDTSLDKLSEDLNYDYKGSRVKGLIYGLIIDNVFSLISVTLIGLIIGTLGYLNGVPNENIELFFTDNTNILITFIANGVLFSIWAGYITAKTINYSEYKFVIALALISLILGQALKFVYFGTFDELLEWNVIVSYVLYVPSLLFGAWMWVSKKDENEK